MRGAKINLHKWISWKPQHFFFAFERTGVYLYEFADCVVSCTPGRTPFRKARIEATSVGAMITGNGAGCTESVVWDGVEARCDGIASLL